MKTWKEITTSRPDTPERRAAHEQGRQEAVAEIVAYHFRCCATGGPLPGQSGLPGAPSPKQHRSPARFSALALADSRRPSAQDTPGGAGLVAWADKPAQL